MGCFRQGRPEYFKGGRILFKKIEQAAGLRTVLQKPFEIIEADPGFLGVFNPVKCIRQNCGIVIPILLKYGIPVTKKPTGIRDRFCQVLSDG
jgi:hypothetical protein